MFIPPAPQKQTQTRTTLMHRIRPNYLSMHLIKLSEQFGAQGLAGLITMAMRSWQSNQPEQKATRQQNRPENGSVPDIIQNRRPRWPKMTNKGPQCGQKTNQKCIRNRTSFRTHFLRIKYTPRGPQRHQNSAQRGTKWSTSSNNI